MGLGLQLRMHSRAFKAAASAILGTVAGSPLQFVLSTRWLRAGGPRAPCLGLSMAPRDTHTQDLRMGPYLE